MKYKRIDSWIGPSIITEDGRYIIEKAWYGAYRIRSMTDREWLADKEGFVFGFRRLKDAKAHLEKMYR